MSERPRWVDITSTIAGIVVFTTLGRYYNQWVLGAVAAITVAGLVQALYRLVANARSSRAEGSAVHQHAVIVYLAGAAAAAGAHGDEDLSTLETTLTDVIDAGGLGEYDGNEIGERGAILYMYGDNAERLYAGVEPTLRSSRICKGARILIRPGPPATPAREVRF